MNQNRKTLLDRLLTGRGGAPDKVLAALLKARAGEVASEAETAGTSDAYFMTRLRSRIQERQAQMEGGVWENAVLAARGWLLAFGVIASLLFAPNLASLLSPAPSRPAADSGLEMLALTPHDATGNITLAALDEIRDDAAAAQEATHAR